MTDYFRTHRKVIIPCGIIAGLILGIVARLWMRWISTDLEFTWTGTISIVLVFVIFGAIHSIVFFARVGHWPRRKLNLLRFVAIFFTLPLFGAAGAQMFPTVLAGSLASWRSDWWMWVRVLLGICSAVIPTIIIRGIGDDFGWEIATFGRVLLFIAVYSVVIVATRSAVAPIAKI
ncbi:MAG: hypothetical protein Q8L08_00300 [Candidatus Nanopelagicaceae bacterium]|nr:hypothetical protein [Candidatus Nanopelagicaceae bacterium]